MKVDYLGRELNVGDKVVFIRKNYRDFITETITKICVHKLKLDTTYRWPGEVIKIVDKE